jgi:hypothetical protein
MSLRLTNEARTLDVRWAQERRAARDIDRTALGRYVELHGWRAHDAGHVLAIA